MSKTGTGGDIKGTPFMNATAGAIAAAIEITLDYPTEYGKTVMQLYP